MTQTEIIDLAQRLAGLTAFVLLFLQLILYSLKNKITKISILTYLFVFLYPLLLVLLNYKLKGVFDPFYVFTDVCVLCKNRLELFYTLERISFWLITLANLGYLLKDDPWFGKNWPKFYALNYLAFFLFATHLWFVVGDARTAPFKYFFFTAVSIVAGVVIYKLYNRIRHRLNGT